MGNMFQSIQGYIFAALWLIIAVYLCYQGHKTHKIFYIISLLFFFMGGWYIVNELIEVNLFSYPYAWIFRGICAVFLVIIVIFIFINRKKILSQIEAEENSEDAK